MRFSNPANFQRLTAVLILLTEFVCVCRVGQANEPHRYEYDFPALGTLVSLKAYHADEELIERAFADAERRAHELAAVLTDYDPESETRQLSLRAIEQPVVVSDDLWPVLAASDRWYSATDGAFDASLGTLTRLWRKYRRVDRLPSPEQVRQALELSGWRHVRLNRENRSLQLMRQGIHLDFGAIGKGFIVDEIYKTLCDHGVEVCLVNISGNMRCGHAPPGKQGWQIAIAPLVAGGEPLRTVPLEHQAIATSGDLWQFVVIDGVRRSHVLDPTNGYGVPGPLSVTAIAPNATDADALATAACILGFGKAAELVQPMAHTHLFWASRTSDADPQVLVTEGFPPPTSP